jgi:hypothetical protein
VLKSDFGESRVSIGEEAARLIFPGIEENQ